MSTSPSLTDKSVISLSVAGIDFISMRLRCPARTFARRFVTVYSGLEQSILGIHPLAKKRAIKIRDLRDQPLIMYPRESGIGLYWQVLRLCANAGFRPQIAREVQELTTIVSLVDAGEGIAVVPADTRSIHLDGVSYVPLHDKEAFSTLYLAFRERDRNAHLRGLLSKLRERPASPAARNESA